MQMHVSVLVISMFMWNMKYVRQKKPLANPNKKANNTDFWIIHFFSSFIG